MRKLETSVGRVAVGGRGCRATRVYLGAALALALLLPLGPAAAAERSPAEASDSCVLQAGPDASREHEGVTDYDTHLRPNGELSAIMLFVDFEDANSDDTPSAYFDRLEEASEWFADSSYGRVSLDIDPVLQWFRMPDPSTDYGVARGSVTFESHRAFLADAVRVADDAVGFSGYDLLYVVTPDSADEIDISPAFIASPANGIGARDDDPDADGNVLRFGANLGDNVWARVDTREYRVLNHETGHVFGLPDLYAYSGTLHRFVGEWDLMGRDDGDAPDLLAWHKRKLGWLDPAQLACLADDGTREYTLSPVETSGGTKAVVVPVGEHRAYVAEVRERTGLDSDACSEGVLIYEVNTNAKSGEGPVRVHTPDGAGPGLGCVGDPEMFAPGQGRDDGFFDPQTGVAFEVLEISGGGYTVLAGRGVEQQPPVADAGGPYVTAEGESIGLDGTGSSDPNPGDELTYAWDTDGDGEFDDPAAGPNAPFARVGRDGVFDIALRVTDASGAVDVDETTVTVDNVAPTVEFDLPATAREGEEIVFTGKVTDPGWLDPLDVRVDWGPGGGTELSLGPTDNNAPDASRFFEAHHVYGDDGRFSVEVCGRDDDGETCVSDTVDVGNVAPSAAIDAGDAVEFGGRAVLLAEAGQPTEFSGRATDPGSDDLQLVWDFGDGTPGVSTTSLVNPPAPDGTASATLQPRDLTDTRTHPFDEACTHEVVFSVTDDDGGQAADRLQVLVTGNADEMRGAGYWTHQARGNGRTDLDPDALECRLAVAAAASDVLGEVRDAATSEQALDILRVNGVRGDMRDLFDRQALVAWLNFASGALVLDEAVDTDSDGTLETPFGQAIADAESIRLDPAASRDELERSKNILERINTARR